MRNNVFIFLFSITMFALSSIGTLSYANDTQTEFPGGNIVFKENKDIIIEKEDLSISRELIDVSYVFFNSSDKDITCEVAFPIPPYSFFNYDISDQVPNPFNFKLYANNEKKDYKIYHKAINMKGIDVTEKLSKLKIPVDSFKYWDAYVDGPPQSCKKLNKEKSKELIEDGLIELDEYGRPVILWDLQTIYYWTQTFPAKSKTLIRHTYTPSTGGTFFTSPKQSVPEDACLDEADKRWIQKNINPGEINYIDWVSYILTTANNWKKPIEDFHLIIKKSSKDELVSLCFDGEIKKTGPLQFEARIKDFIPTKEIKVYYIFGEHREGPNSHE